MDAVDIIDLHSKVIVVMLIFLVILFDDFFDCAKKFWIDHAKDVCLWDEDCVQFLVGVEKRLGMRWVSLQRQRIISPSSSPERGREEVWVYSDAFFVIMLLFDANLHNAPMISTTLPLTRTRPSENVGSLSAMMFLANLAVIGVPTPS